MFCPVDKVYVVVCFLLDNSPASEVYICRLFGTIFHLHRRVGNYELPTYPPMDMEQIERSETSAHQIQTPGNYP